MTKPHSATLSIFNNLQKHIYENLFGFEGHDQYVGELYEDVVTGQEWPSADSKGFFYIYAETDNEIDGSIVKKEKWYEKLDNFTERSKIRLPCIREQIYEDF